jgi:uncharacterized MnhB-related membrane protein
MALKKKEMNKNKKIRIFKYVLLFLFYIFSIICVITNFRWRGNPPLKWEEIPNILPIILPLCAIVTIYLYYKYDNEDKF